jgi:hypothetical protein
VIGCQVGATLRSRCVALRQRPSLPPEPRTPPGGRWDDVLGAARVARDCAHMAPEDHTPPPLWTVKKFPSREQSAVG